MLVITALTFALLGIFITIGLNIVRVLGRNSLERLGDRLLISFWLGAILVGNLALLVGTTFALRPYVSGSLILFLLFISLRNQAVVQDLKLTARSMTKLRVSFLIALAFILSFFASVSSSNIDTGAYHFQFAKWLSEYGVVKGVGLILYPVAISTSWLPLTALVNFGILEDRCHGVMQALACFVFIAQAALSFYRLNQKTFRSADIFYLISFVLVWPNIDSVNSMTVNTVVAMAIPCLAYLVLVLYDSDDATKEISPPKYRDNLFLVFCFAVASLKLTALPIIPLGILLLIILRWRSVDVSYFRFSPLTLILIGVFAFAPLIYSTLTSGYPLFLSTILKFDLAWTLPIDDVRYYSKLVSQYWSCIHPGTCDQSRLIQIWAWILDARSLAFLVFLNIALIIFRREPHSSANRTIVTWLILLGASSSVFFLFMGPSITYSLGWMAILPSASILALDNRSQARLRTYIFPLVLASLLYPRLAVTRFADLNFAVYCILVAMFLCFIHTNIIPEVRITRNALLINLLVPFLLLTLLVGKGFDLVLRFHPDLNQRLLIPDPVYPIQNCSYEKRSVNDVDYWKATNLTDSLCECWSKELPCSGVHEVSSNMKLKDRSLGLAGGIVRASDN